MNYFEPYGWPGYVYPPPVYLYPSPPHYAPSFGPAAFPRYTPYHYGGNGIYGEMVEPINCSLRAASQPAPANEIEVPSPRNSTPKKRRKLHARSSIRKPNKMKPERSALTNITNQLLTFLYLKRKNADVMRRLSLDLSR